jgi:hypothetical protein
LWGFTCVGSLQCVVCARCGHLNQDGARFCSSCGAPLTDTDDATLTLQAVEAADATDELEAYLEGLPAGVALLVVRHGPNAGATYRLDDDETTVGRHPDSVIFLDDITVSRRHVRITRADGRYHLEDVGSLNATYVNRERVDAADLTHGDEVQIGRYRLSFVFAEPEA